MSILALCFVVWAAPFDAAALSAEARAVREAAILQLALQSVGALTRC